MKNAEKDWLKVNKMCREIKWLEILEQLKEKLAEEIDK